MSKIQNFAEIPMRNVGPIKIVGLNPHVPNEIENINVPLATLEVPLWPSVARGASVSRLTDGIKVAVIKATMTRSIVLETESAMAAVKYARELPSAQDILAKEVTKTSKFAKLLNLHIEVVGKLLYVRFSFEVADAAGHNMTTKAAEGIINFILAKHPDLKYVSLSANLCVDKKVSAINGILGRGKYVVAEMIVPKDICQQKLRVLPEELVALNNKKNLLGSILAGSVRSANAHFANMLLAIYLATGQDAANIVEGSQGITYVDLHGQDLYFSVTLPNVIVGTVGSGKDLTFVQENLNQLGCLEKRDAGENAARLAAIIGAAVLCGELSLLAALANRGELVRGHMKLERRL